jgi:hypothetical protein
MKQRQPFEKQQETTHIEESIASKHERNSTSSHVLLEDTVKPDYKFHVISKKSR